MRASQGTGIGGRNRKANFAYVISYCDRVMLEQGLTQSWQPHGFLANFFPPSYSYIVRISILRKFISFSVARHGRVGPKMSNVMTRCLPFTEMPHTSPKPLPRCPLCCSQNRIPFIPNFLTLFPHDEKDLQEGVTACVTHRHAEVRARSRGGWIQLHFSGRIFFLASGTRPANHSVEKPC